MFYRRYVRISSVLVVIGLIWGSTMWAIAQADPTDASSSQASEAPAEVVSAESLAQDGDSPEAQLAVGPLSAAEVTAFDAPQWTVQNNLGVGTQTPAAPVDIFRNTNGMARIQVQSLNTGNSTQAQLYLTTGSSNGLQVQKFGSGYSTSWNGIGLANWTRLRTDTSAKGLIVTTASANPLILGTSDQERLRIRPDGKVGIGTTAPRTPLHVYGRIATGWDFESPGAITFFPPDGFAWFHIDNGPAGRPDGRLRISSGGNPGDNEIMSITQDGNVGIGTPAPVAKLDVAGTTRTDVLQIDAGGDLAEPFDVNGTEAVEPGMVVAIDPEHPGQLRLADKAYDRTVAGVISGAGGIQPGLILQQAGTVADGEHPVALSGRVYVWADAVNGPIQPGDLLTTADTPGHAMKATDYEQAQGAILGKAMSSLAEGTGLVLVLVSLQ